MKHFIEITTVSKLGIQVVNNPALLRAESILRVEKVTEENPNFIDGVNCAIQYGAPQGWYMVRETYDTVKELLQQQVSDGWSP